MAAKTRASIGNDSRGGFTLIELLVVIAIIALIIGILLPALGAARATTRALVCKTNQRAIAQAGAVYAADFDGTIFALSWTSRLAATGRIPKSADVPGSITNDLEAMRAQGAVMLEEIWPTGEIQSNNGVDFQGLQVQPELYTNLVLFDYLGRHQFNDVAVCPFDTTMDELRELRASADAAERQLSFPTSYFSVPSTFTSDRDPGYVPLPLRRPHPMASLAQRADFNVRRRMSDVRFTSQKVWLHELVEQHKGRLVAWCIDDAAAPVTMFDGSVSDRRVEDARDPVDPSQPGAPLQMLHEGFLLYYETEIARASSGFVWDVVRPVYRWTEGGLGGYDFTD